MNREDRANLGARPMAGAAKPPDRSAWLAQVVGDIRRMQDCKLLIIDDEPAMVQLIEAIFKPQGAEVYTANRGEDGLKLFYEVRPDLILLDVMMPGMDGLEVARQIRQLSDVPIIMITVLGRADEIVRGLDAGADDYVTKPFNTNVLLARARAALRRGRGPSLGDQPPQVYDDGYLRIDLGAHWVSIEGQAIKLSVTEYELLAYLLQNADQTCTFGQILANVWGDEYRFSAEYVHVYVWHLRQKLERNPKEPEYILSLHSVGYLFRRKEVSPAAEDG
ncbi:MAG: response regulator transcription factor [Candidatus Promineifilaceae bacterium]